MTFALLIQAAFDRIGPAGTAAVALAAATLAGVLVDRWCGEPARYHPLVGFGRMASALERRLNQAERDPAGVPSGNSVKHRIRGVLAWSIAVLPLVAASYGLSAALPAWPGWLLQVGLLWFALGARSLEDHIAPIGAALVQGDLSNARMLAARVVSRDLSEADATGVARAAVESALENGNDAVFGTLFWFVVAGGSGALAFRLINTLDAMWGYRTPRFHAFGWAAARIDDIANWLPARLSAASYGLLGHRADAWRCWRTQAALWDSPNAGPVMAAGAGSLRVQLGGAARYHGVIEERPVLGCGAPPEPRDVARALRLVRLTTAGWVTGVAVLAVLFASVSFALHGFR